MTERTLKEARDALFEALWHDGSICECCGQKAKIRPTPINKAMASGFKWLVHESNLGENYVAVQRIGPDFMKTSNSHAKLRHWGLLEDASNEDPAKKRSGLWRPTAMGMAWYRGEIKVPLRANLYNNQCFGFQGKEVYFSDRFDPFHYEKEMSLTAAQPRLDDV